MGNNDFFDYERKYNKSNLSIFVVGLVNKVILSYNRLVCKV
jgi:hypothetical protein